MITTRELECYNNREEVEARSTEFHANKTEHLLWRKVAGSGILLAPTENSTHKYHLVPSLPVNKLSQNMAGGKLATTVTTCFNYHSPLKTQLKGQAPFGTIDATVAVETNNNSCRGEERSFTGSNKDDEESSTTTMLDSSSDEPSPCSSPSKQPNVQKVVTSVLMSLVQPYHTTTTTTTRHQRHSCKPITRSTSGNHYPTVAQKRLELVSLAIALSSCCLIMTANVGYCAPVTASNDKSTAATATTKNVVIANNDNGSDGSDVIDQTIVQKNHQQSEVNLDKMNDLQRGALAEADAAIAGSQYKLKKSEELFEDDEVIVLMLSSPESSNSMR